MLLQRDKSCLLICLEGLPFSEKGREGVEEDGQTETGVQGIKVVNGASSSIGLKTILVSLFTQGALNSVADSSGSLTRVGRVTGLRGERPPKFCTLENIPAMHQRGDGVATGVPSALRPSFKHCRTHSKHSQRSRPGLGRQPEDQGSL